MFTPRKLIAALLALTFVLVVGCTTKKNDTPTPDTPTTPSTPAATDELPRKETLYKGGFQWGPPANFNPIGQNSAWPTQAEMILYEPLFAYNIVKGAGDPIIGESFKWNADNTMTIKLRKEPKWSDGKPLTADDVVWTFEYSKKESINHTPFWTYVEKMEKVNDQEIKITLNPKNPNKGLVERDIMFVRIMPKHIWQPLADAGKKLSQELNMNPVGSGPYKLKSQNDQKIIVERDDNYWGKGVFGTVGPKYIVHPILKSNDAFNLALQNAEIDWSQTFAPQIWKMWEDQKQPVITWFDKAPYHMPASIPMAIINLNKPGLKDPLVRKAIAYSLDTAKVAEIAFTKYSIPAKAGLLIPEGLPESPMFDQKDVDEFGWKYDPAKAVQILEGQLKAKKGADGIYVLPDGTRLGPWKLTAPFGWTDWNSALEILSQSAKAVGIDLKTDFPEQPVWNDARNTGNFDIIMDSPGGGYSPAHPWERFRAVMDSRNVPKIGEVAYWNYNRFTNAAVPGLLDKIAATADDKEKAAAFKELNKIFMQNVPAIPLMYRPWEFYEANEKFWTGFPTAKNPTAPPQHNHAGRAIYFKLKAK